MGTSKQWTTRHEIDFVQGIRPGGKGKSRLVRLRNYLKSCQIREDWRGIKAEKVLKAVQAEIAREERR